MTTVTTTEFNNFQLYQYRLTLAKLKDPQSNSFHFVDSTRIWFPSVLRLAFLIRAVTMAFASTSRHLPRESVYPTPPSSDYLNALEDCVQATEACSRSLQTGLDRFEPGVRDLPRLTKIFKHKHVSCPPASDPCYAMLKTMMELALFGSSRAYHCCP